MKETADQIRAKQLEFERMLRGEEEGPQFEGSAEPKRYESRFESKQLGSRQRSKERVIGVNDHSEEQPMFEESTPPGLKYSQAKSSLSPQKVIHDQKYVVESRNRSRERQFDTKGESGADIPVGRVIESSKYTSKMDSRHREVGRGEYESSFLSRSRERPERGEKPYDTREEAKPNESRGQRLYETRTEKVESRFENLRPLSREYDIPEDRIYEQKIPKDYSRQHSKEYGITDNRLNRDAEKRLERPLNIRDEDIVISNSVPKKAKDHFLEPNFYEELQHEFGDDLDAFNQAGARKPIVTLDMVHEKLKYLNHVEEM